MKRFPVINKITTNPMILLGYLAYKLLLNPSTIKAEDIYQVWAADLVADKAIFEVGKDWWNEDTVQFNSLINGAAEWTSACQWDTPRQPPYQGGSNNMNHSVVSLGDRAITPRNIKYRTLQAKQYQQTLVYGHAFQTLEEIKALFPNRTGKLQIRVRGSVDRCENPNGPTINQTGIMNNSIRFTLRCNSADEFVSPTSGLVSNAPGIWRGRMSIWTANFQDQFPVTEDLKIDQTIYIPFDVSNCDSEMFLTANLPTSQRLTITSLETVLWGD